jgi:conjugative transfer protein CagX
MNRAFAIFFVVCAISGFADELQLGKSPSSEVIHVTTALDHLTVLEFGEPVTMAAAGSSAFQIERHENKVFIKPLKPGAATDLFVWTNSQRFAYELQPPGEVSNMNFAIDSRAPVPKAASDSSLRVEEVADMMLTRAFLGAQRVNSGSIKDENGRVVVRVEHVFQSRSTLYIHYSVHNHSQRPYRILPPELTQASAPQSSISIVSLQLSQLDGQTLRKLGKLTTQRLTLGRAESQKQDVQPGEETQGVIAIRQQVSSPAILQVTFAPEGSHKVQATMVF